jgi:hypothetical protein
LSARTPVLDRMWMRFQLSRYFRECELDREVWLGLMIQC